VGARSDEHDRSKLAFSTPAGITSDGTNLWEINVLGNTVDELAGANLAFLASSGTKRLGPRRRARDQGRGLRVLRGLLGEW